MATDYSLQLERLARVFNDDTQPPKVLPTKPDDPQSVLSLPPKNLKEFHKQQVPQYVVNERLATLESFDTKEQTQPSLTKQQTDNIHEHKQPIKRGRGRPKGARNKSKTEKVSPHTPSPFTIDASVSENEKVSLTSRKMKKPSQAPTSEYLPVNISIPSQTSVKGKTSLCYALLYSRELTPVQIEALLAKKDEMNLTSAEVIALSLIDRTIKHDVKAEKIYWDLLKNGQKNSKITPVKAKSTLLDEALAKAENAIFGEIVVDKPENP